MKTILGAKKCTSLKRQQKNISNAQMHQISDQMHQISTVNAC